MMTSRSDSIRILLVDDTPTNLKVLSEALQGQGWKTLMATDGESAIEQAEYALPDLILLDVMMPGIDGFETCRRLKTIIKLQEIPIIFMTALSDSINKVKGLELGAVDYITKPFQQEEVIARVKLHLKLFHLNRELEQRVQERTSELEASLQRLKTAQLQLIQSEKMSNLGQLVAGIGHEINNPINFIVGNLEYVEDYTNDLFKLIRLYQEKYPNPNLEITELTEDIDLEYVSKDLPNLMFSVQEGANRLQDISLSLRSFARSDTTTKVNFQIHEGIESTLMLLKHRLKAFEKHLEIQIIKDYGEIPPISCYPGQLNQVFMNIIANAIDAFEELNQLRSDQGLSACQNIIWIRTAIDLPRQVVTIGIRDNGAGMSPEVQAQIFEPSFTTKPVGKGTGLGLPISRQIIQKHGGQLDCHSVPQTGTEFTIAIPINI